MDKGIGGYNMKEIRKELEELKGQKYLPLLPNKLSWPVNDPRSGILDTLSLILLDYVEVTAKEMVQILRDIADAIEKCTEPF